MPKEVPVEYKPIAHVLSVALVLCSAGVVPFVVLYFYPALQAPFMPEGLVFRNDGQFILSMLSIFIGVFVLSILAHGIIHFIPSWKNYYYGTSIENKLKLLGEIKVPKSRVERMIQMNQIVKDYDLDLMSRSALKRFSQISLALFIITLPIQWVSLNSYVALQETRVLVAAPFSWEPQAYPWEEITSAELWMEEGMDSLTPHFDLKFRTGRTENLWDISIPGTPTEDLLAAKDLLEEKGVYVSEGWLPSLNILREPLQEQIREVFSH